uniref:acyl-CoA dehydratase activase-related protein n=1 Tax=uncultured Bifidobacterium sp. TaxID=165187 RepID=UPI0025833845
ASEHPVDLGSRCTVFMNSSVKQAQKEGASIEDIAAGLCYSVVRNALYKVIKLRDSGELGSTVVVQGGTFLNDAVLRAFELLTERDVTRPNIAGLMGAYGAALTARMHYDDVADDTDGDARSGETLTANVCGAEHTISSILTGAALDELTMTSERDVCKLCQNHCKLTITTFHDGSRYVTGNRCERGGDAKRKRSDRPNLYDYKYKRAFAYRRLTDNKATRGEIGIPRVLNMYENYPFWFTLLTNLGFKVVISGRSNHELFETGIESIASENICYPAKLVHGHIKWLLNKGIRTIFYPCVSFEDDLVPDADNHYNCPIVANYPVVIDANMEALRADGVRFMKPYFNLAKHDLMVDRIVEEFAWAGVTRDEAETAVAAAYAEDSVFKHDVRQEGLRALAYMKEHGCRGIVLAGRPYHVDPEINHGIPETICSLGMAVLSEDSISWLDADNTPDVSAYLVEGEDNPRAHDADGFRHAHAAAKLPLRVMDQWAYHARLYRAADVVAHHSGLELVQLNSFGCGLDAITTDQVAEILADKADVYTMLKIDEVSNLGAAKIRLRSLKAAIDERERNKETAETADAAPTMTGNFRKTGTLAPTPGRQAMLDAIMAARGTTDAAPNTNADHTTHAPRTKRARTATMSHYAQHVPFTKAMRTTHTIVAPQMSPIHFRLVEAAVRASGYHFDVLDHADKTDVETGLKYVNNDACYPAIMTVGQLVEAIRSGRYDPDTTALAITQTGGMCRATNYYALIRKALIDAGYPQIPVLAISTQGFVDNPGFTPTVPLLHRVAKSLILGDLLMKCLYRVRPYELHPGSANRLYERWNAVIRETLLNHGRSTMARNVFGREHWTYAALAKGIVRSFDALPRRDVPRKTRVGVVGEILVKYHPDANNHVVDVIESQDCEAVVPGIIDFMTMRPYINEWNEHNIGTGRNKALMGAFKGVINAYMKPVRDALGASDTFDNDLPMGELVKKAATVTSIGVQAGEGWLLSGEIVELIESGCPNVICAQPFACLPNHVTGRGMFGKIRRMYPEANIVSIDYDPGASEANQLNRIKLMIAAAKKAARR